MKRAIAYLLAITVAETLTVILPTPLWGVLAYIAILAVLIISAALAHQPDYQRLLASLALVPLIRIIGLSMPLAQILQIWRYPIIYPFIYIPLAVAALLVTRLVGYRLPEIGFQVKRLSTQLAIALSGFVFGMLEYFILTGEAKATAPLLLPTWLLSAFLLVTTTGFVEELIFRGVLQRSAEQTFGWWGIVYVSYLFAIVHLIHHSLLDVAFVFMVAMFLGWAVKKTGSLVGVTLAHGIANIVLFLVAPLLF